MIEYSPSHLRLLGAAIFPDGRAELSWKRWIEEIDFNELDPASYQLLPLVVRNEALRSLIHPSFEKAKGIYRRTWVENRLRWMNLLPVLSGLQREGVSQIVILKGMAMILAIYRDFGARVLGDLDILIPRNQLPQADSYLRRQGWQANVSRLNLLEAAHLNRWHALNFTLGTELHLDLHWSFIQEHCGAIDEKIFQSAQSLVCEGVSLCIPFETDLFFQACIHGLKKSPVPLIRWMVDAMTLLRRGNIDWERVFTLARMARVSFPLSQGLQFLEREFEAPIPQAVLLELIRSPALRLEILESRFHTQGHREVAAWFRYCLNRGYFSKRSQLFHLPRYLQTTARLKSVWLVPFFGVYWVGKRLARWVRKTLKR
jgi:hypothetical protein